MASTLFFVAIVLPEPLSEKVNEIKREFAVLYNSNVALKVMPHITLKAPFTVDSMLHAAVPEWFSQLTVGVEPFEAELNGYGSFDNKEHPVIFINPAENLNLLNLQQQLIQSFANSFDADKLHPLELKKFHPHVTIGYRDLTREQFEIAWPNYKNKSFNEQFTVKSFWLLQHDGKQWIPIAEKVL